MLRGWFLPRIILIQKNMRIPKKHAGWFLQEKNPVPILFLIKTDGAAQGTWTRTPDPHPEPIYPNQNTRTLDPDPEPTYPNQDTRTLESDPEPTYPSQHWDPDPAPDPEPTTWIAPRVTQRTLSAGPYTPLGVQGKHLPGLGHKAYREPNMQLWKSCSSVAQAP